WKSVRWFGPPTTWTIKSPIGCHICLLFTGGFNWSSLSAIHASKLKTGGIVVMFLTFLISYLRYTAVPRRLESRSGGAGVVAGERLLSCALVRSGQIARPTPRCIRQNRSY